MIIKSKKFTLRPFKDSDEGSLIENINDKGIYRYTCRIQYPYTRKYAKEWLKHCKKVQRSKKEIIFAIDVKGKAVGCIALENIKKHKAEIGYWLGKKYWGKGIMGEAVKMVTRYAFEKLRLKRVYASVFKQNGASAKVLEKNGYRLEGVLRKDHMKDSKLIDIMMYAKVK